jgi:hypothetical protein
VSNVPSAGIDASIVVVTYGASYIGACLDSIGSRVDLSTDLEAYPSVIEWLVMRGIDLRELLAKS